VAQKKGYEKVSHTHYSELPVDASHTLTSTNGAVNSHRIRGVDIYICVFWCELGRITEESVFAARDSAHVFCGFGLQELLICPVVFRTLRPKPGKRSLPLFVTIRVQFSSSRPNRRPSRDWCRTVVELPWSRLPTIESRVESTNRLTALDKGLSLTLLLLIPFPTNPPPIPRRVIPSRLV